MNTTEIINTPGYYYAIGYWLCAFLVTFINPHKRIAGKKKILIDLLFFAVLFSFMFLTSGMRNLFFLSAMLVIVLMILAYLLLSLELPLTDTGILCIRVFITGEFMASLVWQVYFRVIYPYSGKERLLLSVLSAVIIYSLLFLLFYQLEKYFAEAENQIIASRKTDLFITLALAIIIYFISNMSYVSEEGLFSSTVAADIFVIRTLADLVGVVFVYAYQLQICHISRQFELNTLLSTMDAQKLSYELSKESVALVNQKYHDLKHQILLLKEQTPEDKQKYLTKMEEEIRIYEAQNKTGNKVLDVILTSKTLLCQKEGIELKTIAAGENLKFMEDLDISALFGNMLDNAIEAMNKVTDQEKKMIKLQVRPEKGFLHICVSNYCQEDVKFVNGIPRTTKKDMRIHGYGIKSIQTIVGKYNGSVKVSLEDHWFQVNILIPTA